MLSGLVSLLAIYGLAVLEVWPSLAGIGGVILAVTWFLDRMVWLFEDMKCDNPLYQNRCY